MLDLKPEDLSIPCPACGGTGKLRTTSSGPRMDYGQPAVCPACRGQGYQLTDAGKVLAAFVKRIQ